MLSGAGISAESGIKTFRDSNGLWENHRIEDVASPEGFARNPQLVLDFYNARRKQLKEVEPNTAQVACRIGGFFRCSYHYTEYRRFARKGRFYKDHSPAWRNF